MASIRFNLKPVAGNKVQIRAIFQNGADKQVFKNIGYSIPQSKVKKDYKYWDKQKQLVRGLDNADTINSVIEKWKSDFTSYKDDCRRLKAKVDISQFIKHLDGEEILKDVPSLLYVTEKFITSIAVTHDTRTRDGYTVIKTQLQKFQKYRRREILVSDIDNVFYKEISIWFMQHENNHNLTISRKLGKIITILNYGINDLKIKTINPDYQKRYKLKNVQAAKFPLRPEELATLHAYASEQQLAEYRKELQDAESFYSGIREHGTVRDKQHARGRIKDARAKLYERMVLDAFLLACETGLRHSDIVQLQPAHIKSHVTPGGIIQFIDLSNIKTDNNNNMPLSDRAISIIDNHTHADATHIFKFHHSQTAGEVLKTIFKKEQVNLNRPCEVIQIKGSKTTREMHPLHEVISFHMGRNTYITRLLSSNLAPALVKDNAGHSDLKTTMGYFRNDDVSRWKETLKILNN